MPCCGGYRNGVAGPARAQEPFDLESQAELRDWFRDLHYNDEIKAVVFTSNGGNFSSGGDVHEIIGPLARVNMGAVVVNSMSMLHAGELGQLVDKAEIRHALCDTRLLDELVACAKGSKFLTSVVGFDVTSNHDAELDRLALEKPASVRRWRPGAMMWRFWALPLAPGIALGEDAFSLRSVDHRRWLYP